MFGVLKDGRAYLNRLLRRVNPNQKRPGPVQVAVSSNLLPSGSLEIYLDGQLVDSPKKLRQMVWGIHENDKEELPLRACA